MPHSMFVYHQVNIRAVQYSQRVCLRFLWMFHLATPASVAEDYVAFVVDVGKRRGERSVTKTLPETWYGLCVFTELSINRDYFRIQHWFLLISETELLNVRCYPIIHIGITNYFDIILYSVCSSRPIWEDYSYVIFQITISCRGMYLTKRDQ